MRPSATPSRSDPANNISGSQGFGDDRRELPERLAAMADGVLLLDRELRRGLVVPVGLEEHVVPETAGTAQFADHRAGHLTPDDDIFGTRPAERHRRDEG